MGEIYKIINDYNDKVYIGKTVKTTEARKREHLSQLEDGTAIHNAILKHGIEHFKWITIEQNIEDRELLAEREKYWINYYNSYNNGYNMTLGGEGGNGTHAENLKLWREKNPELVQKNITKLKEWKESNPNEYKQNILKGVETRKQKYGKDITKKANEAVRKKVLCIETNIIYNSASEAAKVLNKSNGSHIGQVCNGQRKTAFGYHWEWVN